MISITAAEKTRWAHVVVAAVASLGNPDYSHTDLISSSEVAHNKQTTITSQSWTTLITKSSRCMYVFVKVYVCDQYHSIDLGAPKAL